MTSILQSLVENSDMGIRLAIALGRILPPGLGYPLVLRIAMFLSSRKSWQVVRWARVNQWVVSGGELGSQELNTAVEHVFSNQALSLYDYYRSLASPEHMQNRMILDQSILNLIAQSQQSIPGQGKIVVGIHLSNFDYGMQAAIMNGLKALIISLAELPGGYQRQFDLRRNSGMELVTASKSSLRMAVERLKNGGVVLTGVDRPINDAKYKPTFFKHPAFLPVHHILLARKSKVPIIVAAVTVENESKFRFIVSDPIDMRDFTDHDKAVLYNAELVLQVAESYITKAPRQWMMFRPVWPDMLGSPP